MEKAKKLPFERRKTRWGDDKSANLTLTLVKAS